MNFHRVSHLNRQDVRIEELTVHSLEMGMYLAEVNYDDRLGFLVDENNKPQQFHSVEEVKQAFASLPDNRTPTVEDWQLLSQNWQQLLDSRIAYMLKLREYLTGCIGCGCLSMTKCPLYNPDDTLASQGSGPVLLDQAEQKGLAGL